MRSADGDRKTRDSSDPNRCGRHRACRSCLRGPAQEAPEEDPAPGHSGHRHACRLGGLSGHHTEPGRGPGLEERCHPVPGHRPAGPGELPRGRGGEGRPGPGRSRSVDLPGGRGPGRGPAAAGPGGARRGQGQPGSLSASAQRGLRLAPAGRGPGRAGQAGRGHGAHRPGGPPERPRQPRPLPDRLADFRACGREAGGPRQPGQRLRHGL